MQLQHLGGFTRLLDGESLVDRADVHHWGLAETTAAAEEGFNFNSGGSGDDDLSGSRPDAITVRHGYEVSAEPRR